MALPFQSVLIYGMGMMGASLGAALRERPEFEGEITGVVRSKRSADFLKDNKLAHHVIESDRLAGGFDLKNYDLIVLGVPVETAVQTLEQLPNYAGIVTDMCSTRRAMADTANARKDIRFVGSHPMCGSEDSGPSAFKRDLFVDRLCIITPRGSGTEQTSEEEDQSLADARLVEGLWHSLGMKTYYLSPQGHDELVAYLSHTPHLLSGMLALWARGNEAVARSLEHSPMPVTGGGFKDMARIAGSNPEMWTDIIETNRDFVLSSLEQFVTDSQRVLALLKQNDRQAWLDWFAEARVARNRLCGYPDDR